MKKQTIMIPNGEYMVPYEIYRCAICGEEIEEAWPHEVIDGEIYCGKCAFKNGLITETEYIKGYLFFMDVYRASVHDGEIYVTTRKNEKFYWERDNSESRKTAEYKAWRTSVFQRDGYTCQLCGRVGGELNAHHIKPFAKYKSLRYDINNGITLCKECHKEIHRK